MRIRHRLGKVVLHLALGVWNLLVLQLEAIVWQAGDILLNEWEESLLIVVAHEVEGEVLGIAVILLGKRHQAIVVDGVDLIRSRNAANLAAQVKGALQ